MCAYLHSSLPIPASKLAVTVVTVGATMTVKTSGTAALVVGGGVAGGIILIGGGVGYGLYRYYTRKS